MQYPVVNVRFSGCFCQCTAGPVHCLCLLLLLLLLPLLSAWFFVFLILPGSCP